VVSGHAPLYRGKFRKVWRWAEWPDRWGPDCGIDIVAEASDGKLWAIQAKAVAPDHSITKPEVDSFLAESNRPQIDFRLLIGTTDSIGANARRVIDEQAKHVAVTLRGDLVSADLVWPTVVGGAAPKPKRAKPRPHQRKAVSAVLRGFRNHNRGRLIMACGTGKTLAGLWIHEQLKSRRTLLFVPSISLVQQNLREWGRHAKDDFDCLVVCSDESVANDRDDPAIRYVAELGIDVTTAAKDIAAFLAKRRRRPAVVISTYQSSDRVSEGQKLAKRTFDLALCDEAHRLVGHAESRFATVLNDKKIRAERRLFMTATPRYFTDRVKKRATDDDIEIASMDDIDTFGPEFHVLNCSDAISAKPTPLLTDYRVVVIGVTNAEVAAWVQQGKLVRTKDGAETDARTLAAQIGLAKAMREYDLRRVITFHRSIRRASQFVAPDRDDSLPGVIDRLRATSRPSGQLWARHISGETPASQRASMLRALAELPADTRGLISNCACLGEGVDMPALDGIAFIDPKGSVVDIIQAVGRVIRLSRHKTVGTIVIPVFLDESSDADHALEQSAFNPVWQVLKALRAHDQRLADELDSLRTSIGRQRGGGGGGFAWPPNIEVKVPTLLLRDFEQVFYVRAVERASARSPLTIEQILAWADEFKGTTGRWPTRATLGGPVVGETWGAVDMALKCGFRSLSGGTSLGRLLAEHRDARNRTNTAALSEALILEWADKHFADHNAWPTRKSGLVNDASENWANIDQLLRIGLRGLTPAKGLTAFLAKHRRVYRHHSVKPPLSERQILQWADQFFQSHGWYPAISETEAPAKGETWQRIDAALRSGIRTLKGGSSLWILLRNQRGLTKTTRTQGLSEKQILAWADAFYHTHGRWPDQKSGEIPGTDEDWKSLDVALQKGFRDLPGGGSVSRLLEKFDRKKNPMNRPVLSEAQVLRWAKEYRSEHGRLPTKRSGPIKGTDENWGAIDQSLRSKIRGITRCTSLSRLFKRHFTSSPYESSAAS